MTSKETHDMIVIGAGPGGYVAAIKAAQNGKKVALVEKNYLGGTCLNVGCIPSKALLAGSGLVKKIQKAKEFGINISEITIDYSKMHARKDKVVSQIRTSLQGLLKANKIDVIEGSAAFTGAHTIKVTGKISQILKAPSIIIACGSEPTNVPIFPCDHKLILNSTSILELKTLPTSLCIVGGGYIGCEFASLFSSLGVKVTIVEALDSIIEAQGATLSKALNAAFKKEGIEIKTGAQVERIEKNKDSVTLHIKDGTTITADLALVSVGRKINTKSLDLDKAGLAPNKMGAIEVNAQMETNTPGVYAIGDVTGISMLAHVASHQGIVAATNAIGGNASMRYEAIPAVIFTHPEIASVGLTKEQAEKRGFKINIGKFPFMALGKSIASSETEGFTEIISDKETDAILGAHIIGAHAASLIGQMALAINNELTLDCVVETIHAHPTLSEGWLEGSLLAKGEPIHFPPR
ncbi:dihydrolipoyl dehydrogenase [Candidatus Aerophobetes bacterium]|uniref:Dihydrolipoyl dehydrogenase n=1 Tax=Aerophobetes bacterium TaxID=2030807 RepID=A0A2A4X3W2_UNCAE|nr:MAG: dihydrolipoyl dehydrogenase [Candidatus Aerophobetes bacterium]